MKCGVLGIVLVEFVRFCLFVSSPPRYLTFHFFAPTALIPPPTLLSALRHLPLYTSPSLTLTTFPSSLTLLLTPLYSLPSFSHRLLSSLDLRTAMSLSSSSSSDINPIKDGMTTLEIAQEEGVSLRLAKELLEGVEMERGELARDEQGGEGTRWFRNGFQGFVWDGTTVA